MEIDAEKIQEMLVLNGMNIFVALVIFFIGKWAAHHLANWSEKLLLRAKVDETLAKFVRNLAGIGLMVFVVTAALAQIGIQTASFIAVLGAAGFAIGLALQGSLSNFSAGVLILLFRPFKVGDFINAGGVMGTVKEIQIFNTILASPDNVYQILPNAQALSGSIQNYSTNPTRRIDLVIGVSYKDDLKKTKKVIQDILDNHPLVLKDPASVTAVSELGDSSVNFVVRPWVKAADYWVARFDLIERIKVALDQNGISIPFPQRDVHLFTEVSGASNLQTESLGR